MRSVLVAIVGIGLVLAAGDSAGSQRAGDWLSRAYRPLEARSADASAVQGVAQRPAPGKPPPPPPPLIDISSKAVADALRELGYSVGSGGAAKYDLGLAALGLKGAYGGADLTLVRFDYVARTRMVPGPDGIIKVRVDTSHAKAVQAVACDFQYDSQGTPQIPATVAVSVYRFGQGGTITSNVQTEALGGGAYRLSYSHIFGRLDPVDVSILGAPVDFFLKGCHIDVFPL